MDYYGMEVKYKFDHEISLTESMKKQHIEACCSICRASIGLDAAELNRIIDKTWGVT